MRKLFLLIALLFVSAFAHAGSINVTWTNATQRTDGSPLPPVPTRIEYGACNAANTAITMMTGEFLAAAGASGHVFTNVAPGKYCVRARHEDGALPSAWTAVVVANVPVAPPNPPGNLTVTGTVAYNVVKQRDKLVLLAVGTVPSGVACDTSQSVNGHFVVPRNQVSWYGTARPLVVVAQCG